MSAENDGRMSFEQAVHYVQQQPGSAAFAAAPVFGERSDDAEQRAEGARVFVLEGDGAGSFRMRFVAGPFFANVFAANEVLAAGEIPEAAKELRFLPTRCEAEWLEGQLQLLIQKLMQASGSVPAQMPDYEALPERGADAAAVPMTFVGRDEAGKH